MLSSYDYTNELSGENKNGLVYVIDDDADVRESIKWLLESTNYRVEDYECGETFIAQFNENVPSVILCDLRMPGISGSDVQDHLLRRRIDAPFIFITGHGDVPQLDLYHNQRLTIRRNGKDIQIPLAGFPVSVDDAHPRLLHPKTSFILTKI